MQTKPKSLKKQKNMSLILSYLLLIFFVIIIIYPLM